MGMLTHDGISASQPFQLTDRQTSYNHTQCSKHAAQRAGKEDNDRQQKTQRRGAQAEPRERPPRLVQNSCCPGQRHGTTVGLLETREIREQLHSTGVGTLQIDTHTKKKKKHEGQLRRMKGIFPQSLIHRSTFRMAVEMSVHHYGRKKTYNNSYSCRESIPVKKIKDKFMLMQDQVF